MREILTPIPSKWNEGDPDPYSLAADGTPFILEVNTLPGMTGTSLVPKIAAGAGIPFPKLCERILDLAGLKA